MREPPNAKVASKGRWKTRGRGPGVWKTRGVENAGCGKCGVWKTRGLVENAGKMFFRQNMNFAH